MGVENIFLAIEILIETGEILYCRIFEVVTYSRAVAVCLVPRLLENDRKKSDILKLWGNGGRLVCGEEVLLVS